MSNIRLNLSERQQRPSHTRYLKETIFTSFSQKVVILALQLLKERSLITANNYAKIISDIDGGNF
jgi:hypothetical protein